MNHITWIDLHNRIFEDEQVDDETLASIELYVSNGFGQILSVKGVAV